MKRNELNSKLTELLRSACNEDVVCGPFTSEVLEKLENLGMVAKRDLVDGVYYYGSCRNARVVKWDKDSNMFWYMRHKFGHVFKESICHPEDDDGFDLFMPVGECEPEDHEVIR